MTGHNAQSNPLLAPSDLDHELPDFGAISVGDLVPTFRTGVVDHQAEIAAIVANPEEPTWENTMDALEASGQLLDRVLAIVFNYSGTDATEDVIAVEETVAPELAAHISAVNMDAGLFARVNALPAQPEGSENEALLAYWLRRFRRGGAMLDEDGRAELGAIDARLAELSTRFGRNVVEAADAGAVLFTEESDLAGLSEAHKARLAQDAADAGREGWLVRLGLPTVQPVVGELEDPAARARVHEASLRRGYGGDSDNTGVLLEIVRLRARRAQLLGYANHAEFVIEEETAGSLGEVDDLLGKLTPAAVANAAGEYKKVVDKAGTSGAGEPVEVSGADWPYWAATLRAEELRVDEAEMKRYFPLDQVLRDGAFFAARRLYGITVEPREDLVGYHPDVRVWEVRDGDAGEPVGLLLTDMYARPTKRGGAWMSSFVQQNNLLGQTPVVVNVLNIAKPAEGEQALLTPDEVATVFHEFGHALHGLLSDVRYPSLSGTSVPRDFVEFPSQINENWALEPEILANYARHVDTGEQLPQEMVEAVRAQAAWGQGFATSEYLAACWLDLAWHRLSVEEAEAVTDVVAFEKAVLESAGLGEDVLPALAPRYSSAYFNHVFAGGYSADYWSYLWAEVLDADGFEGFVDTDAARGDSRSDDVREIDPDDVRFAGDRFRRMILSRGATIDYDDAFWMFRGKQRSVEPLLRRRGLAGSLDQ
ncbi:M3 family metallopeptidase [Corynebacterium sp.]|jgi:peptidyl-dipeptidase Dcp|uniref:M3 family metallopeptidase n=1 Tax=Corynebacterium sp. TaxID=1720 RepID=UPI0025BF55C3|nr:M3 family metallopeptidase [Corynebacterium sp.]